MGKIKFILFILFFYSYLRPEENMVRIKLETLAKENIKIFEFATELYMEKDYYRAITEFLRFKSYCSEEKTSKIVDLLIAEIYYDTQNWDKAIEYYNKFLAYEKDNKINKYAGKSGTTEITFPIEYAEYKIYMSYIENADYSNAEKNYNKIIDNSEHHYYEKTKYVHVLTYISRKNWVELIPVLKKYSHEDSIYRQKYLTILKEIEKHKDIPIKSSVKAGILSAVIPGAGQFYAKRYGDGTTAMTLTIVPLIACIDSYSRNAYFGTLVFGMFFISFYSANIYNAINVADKFNKNQQEKFYKEIVEIARDESLFKSITVRREGEYLFLLF